MIQFAFVSQFPHLQIDVAIKPILYIYNNQIYVVWNSYSYMVNDKKILVLMTLISVACYVIGKVEKCQVKVISMSRGQIIYFYYAKDGHFPF